MEWIARSTGSVLAKNLEGFVQNYGGNRKVDQPRKGLAVVLTHTKILALVPETGLRAERFNPDVWFTLLPHNNSISFNSYIMRCNPIFLTLDLFIYFRFSKIFENKIGQHSRQIITLFPVLPSSFRYCIQWDPHLQGSDSTASIQLDFALHG